MTKISKIAGVFGFFWLSVCFGQQTPQSLYNEGKYQEALALLQQNGITSAADFYNAGNCLYRLGKPGHALAHFEKARRLAPFNSDIRANADQARAALEKSGGFPKDRSFWSNQIVPLSQRVPPEMFLFGASVFALSVAVLCFRARKRAEALSKLALKPGFLLASAGWLVTLALAITLVLASRTPLAAVIADSGSARSGPNTTFTELFKLPAGATVELTGQVRDGWAQVRFSLGNVGWMMEKELLKL